MTGSFNRTFMELKSGCDWVSRWRWCVLIVPLWNWNQGDGQSLGRSERVLIVPLWNWNDEENLILSGCWIVLIVPLWNWNDDTCSWAKDIRSFNRTFMELKWKKPLFTRLRSLSFNRTFMELKYQTKCINKHLNNVLIVPLWNWNMITYYLHRLLWLF